MRSFLFYSCDDCHTLLIEPMLCPECKGSIFTQKQVIFTEKETDLFENKGATTLEIMDARNAKKKPSIKS